MTWTSIGPGRICGVHPSCFGGGYSGRVSAVAQHPSNPNISYVGGASGGVWKTTDGGVTWAAIFDSAPSLWIGAIALDPKNPEIVYIGTGEGNYSAYPGEGVFRSTNGGSSWTKIGGTTLDQCHISDLVVSPANSSLIMVSAHAHGNSFKLVQKCPEGVYRSTDSGSTWTRITQPAGITQEATDLAVSPAAPSVWYVGTGSVGVFKSIDDGVTWTNSSAGLPAANVGRVKLDVSRTDAQRLYAVIHDSSNGGIHGVWTSSNGAVTWAKVTDPAPSAMVCKGQCGYDLTIAVHPTDSNIVVVGGVNLYRSTNAGSSFTNIQFLDGKFIHADLHALAFDSLGRMLVGSDGGIYRVSADVSKFEPLNSDIRITQTIGFISGRTQGPLLVGSHDNGVLMYKGDSTWIQVLGGDGSGTAVDPTDPKIMYFEANLETWKSIDGGSTRTKISTADMAAEDAFIEHNPLLISPLDHNRLYRGGERMWTSPDAGATWSAASPKLGACCISAAAIAQNAPTVYAGTLSGDVWVAPSGSAPWVLRDAGLPSGAFIQDIVTHPSVATDVYVVAGDVPAPGRIWHSTDEGKTWIDITGNLPPIKAFSVAVDTSVTPPHVFVGTHYGVYYSRGGGTWDRLGTGLPNVQVTDLMFETSTRKLVAATYGRGVFTAVIPASLDSPTTAPTKTPTPTTSPPPTPTPTPTSTPTPKPTTSPTPTPTPKPTTTPSPTPSPTPTQPSPSPTPTGSPQPVPDFTRSLSLSFDGHLSAKGRLKSPGAPQACIEGVSVRVRRLGGNTLVKVTKTDSTGRYLVTIPDVAKSYRASVKKSLVAEGRCLKAKSFTKTHHH